MLKLRYDPVFGRDYTYDSERPYIPDYRIHRPYDFYSDWPWRYRVWFPNRQFRRYFKREYHVSNFFIILQLRLNTEYPFLTIHN